MAVCGRNEGKKEGKKITVILFCACSWVRPFWQMMAHHFGTSFWHIVPNPRCKQGRTREIWMPCWWNPMPLEKSWATILSLPQILNSVSVLIESYNLIKQKCSGTMWLHECKKIPRFAVLTFYDAIPIIPFISLVLYEISRFSSSIILLEPHSSSVRYKRSILSNSFYCKGKEITRETKWFGQSYRGRQCDNE